MRARLRNERGIALVMAIGTMMTFTIVVAATITYTSSNASSTRISESRARAVQLAEAGLNEAISILSASSDPRSPNALPAGSATFEGGSVSWSGLVNGDTWSLTATSTVTNPSGAAALHHTVSSQVRIGVDGNGYAPAWQYVYADSLTNCTDVQNNAQISAPFYIQGDLCVSNGATLTADEITVKGKITLLNSSSIGTSADPITALHTSGGCSNTTSGHSLTNCDAAHKVHTGDVNSTFANITKPTVDFDYYYLYAKPGPNQNCTSGTFPGGFDTNTTRDNSRSAADLTPATSYSCTVTSGSSTLGKLIWDATAQTLQIAGIIYIDGDITLSAPDAVYSGRGTIYTSGTVTFDNDDNLCGVANCNVDGWDGDANMIIFVAGKATGTGFIAQNNSFFQGGVYAAADVRQMNSAVIEGPVIADSLIFENFTEAQNWPPIDFVADGAPAPIGSTKLIPVSGTWGG
jgi:Tfp pilus assembly protein PilX